MHRYLDRTNRRTALRNGAPSQAARTMRLQAELQVEAALDQVAEG